MPVAIDKHSNVQSSGIANLPPSSSPSSLPPQTPPSSSPPVSSPREYSALARDPVPDWFEQFWKAHPKMSNKPDTLKAFKSVFKARAKGKREGVFKEIMAGLEIWKESEQWSDPQFIKSPAAWLRGLMWKDLAIAKVSGNGKGPPDWLIRKMKKAIEAASRRLTGAHDVTDEAWIHQVQVCCDELDITFTQELYGKAAAD